MAAVDLVHGSEEAHIREEDGGFHHIVERSSSLMKYCIHIGKTLFSLGLYAFRHSACFRVYGKLT